MFQHIGIVACSAKSAALRGPHRYPEVSMHAYSLAGYMRAIERAALKRAVGI
ncbi:MAG TPA: hypothetical protein VKV74_06810 [Bryobacteraceae bacterium]|nr:hypothetical protein [Bryobacteraceae bacterium]